MKKFFVSFAKSTVLLLFFIIFSCNSCSDDDLFDTVRSTNEEVTAVIIDSTENSTTIQDVTDTSVIAESATNRDCKTAGGKANDIGLKSWCWENISLPSGEPDDNNFSDRQLVISSECNPGQVSKEGNRLRFYLNPTYPKPKNWCSNSYNMRAEFRTAPWKVNHPIGTEEWFGWSYTFGDDYIVDQETEERVK